VAYRTRCEDDSQQHQKARREFKKEIRQCKRESWRSFCACIEGVPESAQLKNILAFSPRGKLGMLRRPDGRWTESLEEMIQHLNTYLRYIFQNVGWKTDSWHLRAKWIPSRDWRVAKQTVTEIAFTGPSRRWTPTNHRVRMESFHPCCRKDCNMCSHHYVTFIGHV